MATSTRLRSFLSNHDAACVSFLHPTAYSAQQTAASAHIKGDVLAKTVLVRTPSEVFMVVLPASHRIDFTLLEMALAGEDVRLASESEAAELFPDCEVGAMPPFGNLYNMRTFCDPSVAEHAAVFFNAGSHNEVLGMAFSDYERLVQPRIVWFARHA